MCKYKNKIISICINLHEILTAILYWSNTEHMPVTWYNSTCSWCDVHQMSQWARSLKRLVFILWPPVDLNSYCIAANFQFYFSKSDKYNLNRGSCSTKCFLFPYSFWFIFISKKYRICIIISIIANLPNFYFICLFRIWLHQKFVWIMKSNTRNRKCCTKCICLNSNYVSF